MLDWPIDWCKSQPTGDWERTCRGQGTRNIYLKGLGNKTESRYKSLRVKLWVSDIINNSILTCLPASSLCFGVLLSRKKHLYPQDNAWKVVPHNGEQSFVIFPYSLWLLPLSGILFCNLKYKEILNVLAGTFLRGCDETWSLPPEKST